jgi:hypothetical protein
MRMSSGIRPKPATRLSGCCNPPPYLEARVLSRNFYPFKNHLRSKIMKTFTTTAATVGALAATALGLAGAAAAAPIGGSSASEAVSSLQAQGYNVQLNGSVTAPLLECTVTGVHGDSAGPVNPTRLNTVYVDVSCPSLND